MTIEEVLKIAHMARLGMTENEAEKFAQQMADLLEHAKMLEEVDTSNVQPIAQITGLKDVFFKDEVQEPNNTKELLEQSPQPVEQNMIRVPKTL